MTIDELQNAQLEKLKELFPALGQRGRGMAVLHAGRFGEGEIDELVVKTPAVFLTVTAVRQLVDCGDGRFSLECEFSAGILTTDAKGLPRDVAGKNMSESIVKWLPNNRFGLLDVGSPSAIAAANLYTGKARGKAVALWAVSWTQTVTGDESDFKTDAVTPENLYIGGELQEVE